MVGASNGKPGGGCQTRPRCGLWELRKILSDRVAQSVFQTKTHKNDHMETITDSQSAPMLTLAAHLLWRKLMHKQQSSWAEKNIFFFYFLKRMPALLDCFFNGSCLMSCIKQKGQLWGSPRIGFWTIMFWTPTSQCHQWHSHDLCVVCAACLCFISIFISLCHCVMRCGCLSDLLRAFCDTF